jgi:hypothetical protein
MMLSPGGSGGGGLASPAARRGHGARGYLAITVLALACVYALAVSLSFFQGFSARRDLLEADAAALLLATAVLVLLGDADAEGLAVAERDAAADAVDEVVPAGVRDTDASRRKFASALVDQLAAYLDAQMGLKLPLKPKAK